MAIDFLISVIVVLLIAFVVVMAVRLLGPLAGMTPDVIAVVTKVIGVVTAVVLLIMVLGLLRGAPFITFRSVGWLLLPVKTLLA